jgi:pilus assembly protein CpaE
VAAITADVLWKRLGDAVLLDLDLHMGTAALALGLDIRDPVADALANAGLDVAMLERFIVRDRGPRVLSTHGSLRGATSFDVEGIERLVTIARGIAKVVVVDLPKGWSEAHQRLMALTDEIVLVTAPDLASLRNSRMILDELAGRTDAPRPKVVLNKAGFALSKEYADADFKEALGSAPAAVIPWDPSPLMAAVVDGKPVSEAGGKAAAGMRAFAATLFSTKEAAQSRAKGASAPAFFKGLFARFA